QSLKRTHPHQSFGSCDHLFPGGPGVQMRVRVGTQGEGITGECCATSAPPRPATSSFIPRLSCSQGPLPNPPFFAFGAIGAPLEKPRRCPPSDRSPEHQRFVGQPSRKPRNSP